MAGDWIKVEQATVDKPEVLKLAEMLGWDRRHALGLLVEFWCWLDKNLSGSCPDFVRHMSRKSLDDVLHVPGFASALEAVGWAKFDDERGIMRIVNADRHNGNTAKTRALDAKRKKQSRLENVREMSGSKPDKNRTREEKRRDITPVVPNGFAEFWNTYPASRRVNKPGCLKTWQSKSLESLSAKIVEHLRAMRGVWTDPKYIPHSTTYLNQNRWETDVSEPQAKRLAI